MSMLRKLKRLLPDRAAEARLRELEETRKLITETKELADTLKSLADVQNQLADASKLFASLDFGPVAQSIKDGIGPRPAHVSKSPAETSPS